MLRSFAPNVFVNDACPLAADVLCTWQAKPAVGVKECSGTMHMRNARQKLLPPAAGIYGLVVYFAVSSSS